MTEPRQILPGSTYKVSRRTAHKEKLFDPKSKEIKGIFNYCLAHAANKTEVEIHGFSLLPDKYFAVVSDPEAKLPEFMRLLNRNVAMAINATRVDPESVWANGKYDADVLEEYLEVVDAMVETFRSPVVENHAQSLVDWEGLWSRPDAIGQKVTVERPTLYFGENGPGPNSGFWWGPPGPHYMPIPPV